jgi:hypothetical protein
METGRERSVDDDSEYIYFRLKLFFPKMLFSHIFRHYHPPSPRDPAPDRITFIAFISSAMTVHQGLFGSAIVIDILHCMGMECWIRLHKE